ncbi:MAG: FAD-dependent oxidoreductase [Alphaproteobacteria bacterium]|nr:FAD-dependent oxidoreductase [Alphaproteobacteria bacterium]
MGTSDVRADIVIIGGGIAGLWLLDSLHQAGYSAIVLNKGALGQGQSIAAQGIIHGGTKYTFGLGLESAVPDLAAMPERWRASLAGQQGPDLRAAPPLADAMQMWLPPQVGGRALATFSQKMMRGRMRERGPGDRPTVLPKGRGGSLFDLDETVVDVPKVLGALLALHSAHIREIPEAAEIALTECNDGMEVAAGAVKIQAQRVVLTAGAGNEGLLRQAGLTRISCQRRPLHQIIVRGMRQPLYLHCVGKSSKPLATITSHPDGTGAYYWYVGGLLAEQGVTQAPEKLIEVAKAEMARLLPGADFASATWATHRVDRAEPAGSGGVRPTSASALGKGGVIAGWPTKLALAPVLADKIMALLDRDAVRPGPSDMDGLAALAALATPTIARPPWETVQQWN